MNATEETPSAPLRLLVADDEESMRHFLQRGLTRLGYTVEAVGDGDQAVQRWGQHAFDAAVLDLKMPHVDGITALSRIRSSDPDAVVLMMTAHGTIATAVEAMHLGAADFLTKPFGLDELELRLRRALGTSATNRENLQLRTLLEGTAGGVGIVAESPTMAELVRRVELLAASDSTVLLTGESGTGKGLVAKALHRSGTRAAAPFVALNCAAMPDTLVESELFGHEAGAFTGAQRAKQGLLLRANRGTVFLDEIGDMSLAAQAKIERFLQEREFLPLGSQNPVRVDVRVIAATNRDLPALVQQGRFRAELLYRLDVISLQVPSLRDRRE
ncbi:MAG: sigma-54-dependent Fis family transcriptional regulator, partial [Planctomycetes bacterium]|nr:sigma-54-dependent Fis family transcriptional regulator [Planctomycetota bacterium]